MRRSTHTCGVVPSKATKCPPFAAQRSCSDNNRIKHGLLYEQAARLCRRTRCCASVCSLCAPLLHLLTKLTMLTQQWTITSLSLSTSAVALSASEAVALHPLPCSCRTISCTQPRCSVLETTAAWISDSLNRSLSAASVSDDQLTVHTSSVHVRGCAPSPWQAQAGPSIMHTHAVPASSPPSRMCSRQTLQAVAAVRHATAAAPNTTPVPTRALPLISKLPTTKVCPTAADAQLCHLFPLHCTRHVGSLPPQACHPSMHEPCSPPAPSQTHEC